MTDTTQTKEQISQAEKLREYFTSKDRSKPVNTQVQPRNLLIEEQLSKLAAKKAVPGKEEEFKDMMRPILLRKATENQSPRSNLTSLVNAKSLSRPDRNE